MQLKGVKNPLQKEPFGWLHVLSNWSEISLTEHRDQEKEQPKVLGRSRIQRSHMLYFQTLACDNPPKELKSLSQPIPLKLV